MIYLAIYIFLVAMLTLTNIISLRSKFFVTIALVVATVFTVSRGMVGTDTFNYTVMIDLIIHTPKGFDTEVGFRWLVSVLSYISDDETIVLRLVSLIICVLFFAAYTLANDKQAFILIVIFFPLIFFPQSMNTLRLGLAFMLFLIAVLLWIRNKYFFAIILILLSMSFHYSIIFAFILFYFVIFFRVNSLMSLIAVGLGLVAIVLFVAINESYLAEKLLLYRSFKAPSKLSGLSALVILAVLCLGFSRSSLSRKLCTRVSSIVLCIGVSLFLLSRFSYAFLRVLDLVLITTPVIMMYYLNTGVLLRAGKIIFFLASVIAMLSFQRNIMLEMGNGPSPFLPYHTFW